MSEILTVWNLDMAMDHQAINCPNENCSHDFAHISTLPTALRQFIPGQIIGSTCSLTTFKASLFLANSNHIKMNWEGLTTDEQSTDELSDNDLSLLHFSWEFFIGV